MDITQNHKLLKKKLIDKTKNREKLPNLEIADVVLVQYNLVDNQYQRKF